MNASTRCSHAWLISNQVHEPHFSVTPCLSLVNYLSALSDAIKAKISHHWRAQWCWRVLPLGLGPNHAPHLSLPGALNPFLCGRFGVDQGSFFLITKHKLQNIKSPKHPWWDLSDFILSLLIILTLNFSIITYSRISSSEIQKYRIMVICETNIILKISYTSVKNIFPIIKCVCLRLSPYTVHILRPGTMANLFFMCSPSSFLPKLCLYCFFTWLPISPTFLT